MLSFQNFDNSLNKFLLVRVRQYDPYLSLFLDVKLNELLNSFLYLFVLLRGEKDILFQTIH